MKKNKKLTVKTELGRAWCVLDSEKDYEKQLDELFGYNGHGLCVLFDGKTVRAFDYFCQETMHTFKVLSFEDTDEEVVLKWVK